MQPSVSRHPGTVALAARSWEVVLSRRTRLLAAGLTALSVSTAGVSSLLVLPSAAAAPAGPVPPVAFPADIEPLSPYLPADSCDYTNKPGVLRFASLVMATYPGTGSSGISNTCAAEGSTSEHSEGRAWDWTVSVSNPTQVGQVNDLFAWLLAPDAAGNQAAMARRLGLMYIIWDAKILGLYSLSAGWRPYSCSGVTACHQNHVHFSFGWAGAMGRTSFWTGSVAPVDYGPCRGTGQMFALPYTAARTTPCPSPGSRPGTDPVVQTLVAARGTTLAAGATGPAVAALQAALGGTTPDGVFGSRTTDLVTTFQERRGLPASGKADPATLDSLITYASGSVPSAPPTGSAIAQAYAALGGAGSYLGVATGAEHAIPGGSEQDFAGGSIFWSSATGAHAVHGAILAGYLAGGGPAVLGFPTGDEAAAGTGDGRFSTFTWSTLAWTRAGGVKTVGGAINGLYRSLGGPTGLLGLPTSDEQGAGDGRWSSFDLGVIGWAAATGAHEVHGDIAKEYVAAGGPTGPLGLPVTDETASVDGVGRANGFSSGAGIWWSGTTGAHLVQGLVLLAWTTLGAAVGPLGYPTSDAHDVPGDGVSTTVTDFQHGTLTLDPATGLVTRD